MVDKSYSQLDPGAVPLDGTEIIPISTGTTTQRVTSSAFVRTGTEDDQQINGNMNATTTDGKSYTLGNSGDSSGSNLWVGAIEPIGSVAGSTDDIFIAEAAFGNGPQIYIYTDITPGNTGWSPLQTLTGYGSGSMEDNSVVTELTLDNPEIISGALVAAGTEYNTTIGTMSITYTGHTRNELRAIQCSISGISNASAGTTVFDFAIYKNGAKHSNFVQVTVDSDQTSCFVYAPTSLVNGDAYDIRVVNTENDDDILVRNVEFTLM